MKQETIDTLFQRYEQMNGQLKRPLVYRVGIDAGFGNYMLHVAYRCRRFTPSETVLIPLA